MARELGFETENVDHMVGIAKYGTGEDYIGIMGHLDVVPVGEGWNHPPFSAYEDENGRIFARGILDNKGPTLSCICTLCHKGIENSVKASCLYFVWNE